MPHMALRTVNNHLFLSLGIAVVAACSDGGVGDDAAMAPDGRTASTAQMVFTASPAGAPAPGGTVTQEVFVMNLDGSGRRQLTSDGTSKFLPHFSPDGTRLVYTKFSVGGYGVPDARSDVALYDVSAAAETLLTRTGGASQPAFSPDGQRIAYGQGTLTTGGGGTPGLYVMNVDGSNPQRIGGPSGADDDQVWGDFAWSSDDWILFVVAQRIDGCFKTRLDKIRPDGSSRTKVTDAGPNCTPDGAEQSGDADPGFSHDGKIIYSSRGFPTPPAGGPPSLTERKLYAFSSDPWFAGKPEQDLSLPSEPSCIEGVPKGSPDGAHILLFRACFDDPATRSGIYLADSAGTTRTWLVDGFGPDWNPVAP
jgi:Tol biopolymer transport system component